MKKLETDVTRMLMAWLFLSLFLTVCFSQQSFYKTWNYQNGLTDEDIKTAYRYSEGFIFFGSGSGIYLFNGEQVLNPFSMINLENVMDIVKGEKDSLVVFLPHRVFIFHPKTYQHRFISFNDSIELSLKGGLFHKGQLYACSNIGLIKINPANSAIEVLSQGLTDENEGSLRIFQKSICLSAKQSKIYMGYQSGILIYDLANGKIAYRKNTSAASALFNWKGKAWYLTSMGNRIFFLNVQDKKLMCYNENEDKLEMIPFHDSLGSPAFIQKDQDDLLIRFSDGVFVKYEPLKKQIIPLTPASTAHFAPSGILPLGLQNQLYYGSRGIQIASSSKNFLQEIHQLKPNSGSNELQQFVKIGKNYFVHFKQQLIALDQNGHFEQQFILPSGLNQIHGILEYPKGELLILGNRGLWTFNRDQQRIVRSTLFHDSLQNLAAQRVFISGCWDSLAGRLILSANDFGLFILETNTNRAYTWKPREDSYFKSVRTIRSFKPNQYICGSQGHDGIMRLSFRSDDSIHIDHLKASLFNKAGFISSICNDLLMYRGYLVAALTSGVARIHFERKTVEKLGFQELPYNSQAMALTAINNELLVSGKHQILKLNAQFQLIRMLELEKNGYIGKILPLKSSLFFFSSSRLMAYSPSQEPNVQKVFIQHVRNGEQMTNTLNQSKLKLPHRHQSVELYFGYNSIRSLASNAFVEYRIQPQQKWLPVYQNILRLNQLNPGKYNIEYRVKLQGNIIDHSFFQLEISPPWYLSKTFLRSSLALLVFFILIGVIFYFISIKKKNLSQLAHIFAGIEEERNRISREFHDGIGPNLSSIRLYAEYFKSVTDEKLRKNGMQISEMINQTIHDVRNIMYNLSPQVLNDHGLINAVKYFANQINSSRNLEVISQIDHLSLSNQTSIHLYRIIQELMNNALKHAQATRIEVIFSQTENQLQIQINDNGIGLRQQHLNQSGFGWRNIQSRAQIIGANIEINTSQNMGTSISITLSIAS